MRPGMLIPLAAALALAACGDNDQTAGTATSERPTATATAPAPAPPDRQASTAAPPATTPPPSTTTAATPPATTAAPAGGSASSAAGSGTAPTGTSDATGAVAGPSAQIALSPGLYRAEQVSLRLNEGGRFTMAEREGSREVEGSYELANGVLTLSDVTGDTGTVRFPIRCRVERTGQGFRLVEEGGDCQVLSDLTFQPSS